MELVEQTNITLTEHIDKERTGGLDMVLFIITQQMQHMNAKSHVVCLRNDHINMFRSGFINDEMMATVTYSKAL